MKTYRRILFCFSAFCLLFLAATSCKSKYESVENDPTNTRIYTLDNGLKVYLSVTKKEPRIQTYIAVRTGSKNDPHETTGLSHYLEHIMFKGTTNLGTINYEAEKPLLDSIEQAFEIYRTLTDPLERKEQYAYIDSLSYAASEYFVANEYDKVMASMGAKNSNAFTSFDETVYQEDIPSNQVEAWAKIQSDRFKNMVIRGFHTELEAVYEECNLGLSDDSGNAMDTLFFTMFNKHPYGMQTTIGTQEHLKNPSITNIKKHFENFYVPNNVAICMAGDFDPDKVIKIIKKYFGDWKRNDNLQLLEFEDEDPIDEHIEKFVYGQESPFLVLAWRFPAAHARGRELNYTPDTLYMLSSILSNRNAGLLDLAVNRPGKVLSSSAFSYTLSDYSIFAMEVEPKRGQTLEEGKEILMEQLERVKSGDFDESLLESIVNNFNRRQMQSMESYVRIASEQFRAFINDTPWDYTINQGERLAALIKEDIVKFANDHFGDNYVQVNKLVAEQRGVQTLEKPAITPIRTNRDTSSLFLREMSEMINSAKPIEPVYVDYAKEMSESTIGDNQPFYYKHNDDNSLFSLDYYFENGSYDNNKINYALDYLSALGTASLSADEMMSKFYALACSPRMMADGNTTRIGLSGIGASLEEAMRLLEDLLGNAVPDEELLQSMKHNWALDLINRKSDKSSNESAINIYAIYGPDNPLTASLKPQEVMQLTSEELIGIVKDLLRHRHSIIYYGDLSMEEFETIYSDVHKVEGTLCELPASRIFNAWSTASAALYVAPYKANQINMYKITTYDDIPYDPERDAVTKLYDTYFGAGMSSIVFQDLREAKGLAYHARAMTSLPSFKEMIPYYTARIYTQNDKMIDAMRAFDEILDEMPVAQNSFDVAKTNCVQNLATTRYNGAQVIWHYISLNRRGLSLDYDKMVYDKMQTLTIEDIIDYQKKFIKGRSFVTGILGNTAELDFANIDKSYGKIEILRTEDIFGY